MQELERPPNFGHPGIWYKIGAGLPQLHILVRSEATLRRGKWIDQARAERSAIESLVFTLKEGFNFGEMVRRTHENVLAEMLEKVLAYNISQIVRSRRSTGIVIRVWEPRPLRRQKIRCRAGLVEAFNCELPRVLAICRSPEASRPDARGKTTAENKEN
jgi:hypothetical protein